ncbi:hypothetical protein, partial [Roseovarius amoyensis]|uniref:hypothetical protein n=1 Tax=Roseovarius amoyensis TaxID=2211448 RepID=UPI00195506B2
NHTTCHNNDPTKSTASRYKTPCFVDLRQTKSGKISRELSKLGQLGGDDGRSPLIALLEKLEQVEG